MNILIAGGAGFLGTNITARLLQIGASVTVLDNLITGRRQNLEPLLSQYPEHLIFIEHDITKPLPVFETQFTAILNLASPASPPAYQQYPLETLHANSLGTEHLLQLAEHQQARFVQASTSEVYGDPLIHPQVEKYWGNVNSYGARAMYDEGKRYAEALIWVYRQQFQVNTGIIRIFNTYGPHMAPSDGRVITNFLQQALGGQPLTVYGDGSQTRSYCFVDDQVEAWVKMLQSDVEGPVNIGNPKEFTILELVKTIEKVVGKKLEIVHQPLPADDPTQRRPDISKAKKLLNWEPQVSLEEGLTKMIAWIKISGTDRN